MFLLRPQCRRFNKLAGLVARTPTVSRCMATCPPYATLDPDTMSGSNPAQLYNLEGGEWKSSKDSMTIPDPLNGEAFEELPNTKSGELGPFFANAASCPKTGLHNPLKNPERYVIYGEIMHQAGHELSNPDTHHRCKTASPNTSHNYRLS